MTSQNDHPIVVLLTMIFSIFVLGAVSRNNFVQHTLYEVIRFDTVSKSLELALEAFENEDEVLTERVTFLEDEVDDMEKTYRKQHIQRLNARECAPKASIVFLDVIGYLERISDHAVKIATGLEEEEFDA